MAEVRIFSEGAHVADYTIDHAEWDADPGADISHRATIEAEARKRAVADGHLSEEKAGEASFMVGEDQG